MGLERTYAKNGGRCIDATHGVVTGKFYGFMPSEGCTLTSMEINNVAVDVKATYGYDVALSGNIIRFPVKEGDFITSIGVSLGQIEVYNA